MKLEDDDDPTCDNGIEININHDDWGINIEVGMAPSGLGYTTRSVYIEDEQIKDLINHLNDYLEKRNYQYIAQIKR